MFLLATLWQKGQVLCGQELGESRSKSQPRPNPTTVASILVGFLSQTTPRPDTSHLASPCHLHMKHQEK